MEGEHSGPKPQTYRRKKPGTQPSELGKHFPPGTQRGDSRAEALLQWHVGVKGPQDRPNLLGWDQAVPAQQNLYVAH